MTASSDFWRGHTAWWLAELGADPAYEDEITPFVLDLAGPSGLVLDVGCGEGRIMSAIVSVGARAVGVDIAQPLLELAGEIGAVVRCELPVLPFADSSFDSAIIVLVLEHLPEHADLLSELARVVRPGGVLALVMNHPIYTAPDSAPIEESDGEVLWRPGRYFGSGFTDEPAGGGKVRFYHRSLGALLSDAARLGWSLEMCVEQGVTASQIERHPPLAQQTHIPRLLGVRWRLLEPLDASTVDG